MRNWTRLGAFVAQNSAFFLDLYAHFASNKLIPSDLADRFDALVLTHTPTLNAMFSSLCRSELGNFIDELKINFMRKVSRMRALEAKKHKLPLSKPNNAF